MNYLDNPRPNQDNQLQEIDLLEYFRIIKKEKKIIISLLFLGIMLGIFWFFVGPTKYIGSSLIEVGSFKESLCETGLLERPEQTIQKIKNKSYDEEVKFFGTVFEDLNLIEIKIEGKDYQKVENVLNKVNSSILEKHFKIFEKKVSRLSEKEKFLEEKIEKIQEEISFLMVRGFDTAPLRAQIHDIEIEMESTKSEIDKILMTEIIEGPDVVEKGQGYLVIAFSALLGLFVGFVLAFLKNFWQKNKKIL